jgi:hypothetical protein
MVEGIKWYYVVGSDDLVEVVEIEFFLRGGFTSRVFEKKLKRADTE